MWFDKLGVRGLQVSSISFLALTQSAEAHSFCSYKGEARSSSWQVLTLVEAGGPIYQLNVAT